MSFSSPVPIGTTEGTAGQVVRVSGLSTYELLAAPFDVVFTDVRGGVSLSYISGEQVVRRMNEVLGVGGWSFRILEHGVHQEADESWALGELVAEIDGSTVTRQQFGSQKVKRSRSTGAPLDIGFDLKGAATDAMKKCASLLGVGLYLSRKETPKAAARQQASTGQAQQQRAQTTVKPPVAAKPIVAPPQQITQPAPAGARFDCEECGAEVIAKTFDDGTVWPPSEIVARSREQYKKVLCFSDLKKAAAAPLISRSGASV